MWRKSMEIRDNIGGTLKQRQSKYLTVIFESSRWDKESLNSEDNAIHHGTQGAARGYIVDMVDMA